jgi:hypothetical protein
VLILFKKGISLKSDPEAFQRFHSIINRMNGPPEHCMRLWSKLLHFLDTQGRANPIEHNGEVIFGHELKAKNVLVEGTRPPAVRGGDKRNETGVAEHDVRLTSQLVKNQFRSGSCGGELAVSASCPQYLGNRN